MWITFLGGYVWKFAGKYVSCGFSYKNEYVGKTFVGNYFMRISKYPTNLPSDLSSGGKLLTNFLANM